MSIQELCMQYEYVNADNISAMCNRVLSSCLHCMQPPLHRSQSNVWLDRSPYKPRFMFVLTSKFSSRCSDHNSPTLSTWGCHLAIGRISHLWLSIKILSPLTYRSYTEGREIASIVSGERRWPQGFYKHVVYVSIVRVTSDCEGSVYWSIEIIIWRSSPRNWWLAVCNAFRLSFFIAYLRTLSKLLNRSQWNGEEMAEGGVKERAFGTI